ncbi:hypothetical protein E2C01_055498 [Portunus trituberculatus]|uniref:Uncharacterized protein n=1 Tax=Portunus trituberculatus TaxID=210409 RepID=A0A5B7GUY7_PORTR|nr:hypothetical protein [Portunus trituberculatus]
MVVVVVVVVMVVMMVVVVVVVVMVVMMVVSHHSLPFSHVHFLIPPDSLRGSPFLTVMKDKHSKGHDVNNIMSAPNVIGA